jgi:hypothetical protein
MFSIATITSTESKIFWNQAKRTLSRYNGIPKAHFPLFLKETEFRLRKTQPAIANSQTLGQNQALANRSGTAPRFLFGFAVTH